MLKNYLALILIIGVASCLPDSSSKKPPTTQGGQSSDTTKGLQYPIPNGTRFWIQVADTAGFESNHMIRGCHDKVNNCPLASATIYHVDEAKKRIYAKSNTNSIPLKLVPNIIILNNSNPLITTLSTSAPIRLYNPTSSLNIRGTLSDDEGRPIISPAITYYSTPPLPYGLVINSTNGTITKLPGATILPYQISKLYTIAAKSLNTNQDLAHQTIVLTIVAPPKNFSYAFGASSDLELTLGTPAPINTPIVSPVDTEENDLVFSVKDALISGLSLDKRNGVISGTVGSSIDVTKDSTTIRVFHPISQDPSTALETTIKSKIGLNFDNIYLAQPEGRTLILEVTDIENFSVGQIICNTKDATGTIVYIDPGSKRFFITLNQDAIGSRIFAPGQALDLGNYFAVERSSITKVHHLINSSAVAGSADDLRSDQNPLTFDIFHSNRAFSLEEKSQLKYKIFPPLTIDLALCQDASSDLNGLQPECAAAGAGKIIDTDRNPYKFPRPETMYQISVTNHIGTTRLYDFSIIFNQSSPDMSVAKLQYVPITPAPTTSFYDGMHISTNAIGNNPGSTGKIIHRYINGSNIEGLLINSSQFIDIDQEIDNEVPFYSAKAQSRKFQYLFVTDASSFSPGDIISDIRGNNGTIVPDGKVSDTNGDRITIEVKGDNFFEVGSSIDNTSDYAAAKAIIISATDQAYVNFLIKVNSSSPFAIGSPIYGSTNDDAGFVVFKDSTNHILYVRYLRGEFSDGETVQNESGTTTTIQEIKSPYLAFTTPDISNLSSIHAGHPLISYQQGASLSSAHRASGALAEKSSNTSGIIQWESGVFDSGQDMVNNNVITSNGDGLDLQTIKHANVFSLYSGVDTHLKTYLRGGFTSLSISPTLPAGLDFDRKTGLISGTPIEVSSKKTYTITATTGSIPLKYSFDLEVLSQFYVYGEIKGQNVDQASSFIMHKMGQGYRTADCRVTSKQIQDRNNDGKVEKDLKSNDIICFVDGAERDLNFFGLTLKLITSPGMCEYVDYLPYGFYKFPPIQTDSANTYVKYEQPEDMATVNQCITQLTKLGGAHPSGEFSPANSSGNVVPKANRAWGETYCSSGPACPSPSDLTVAPTCGGDHSGIDGPNCDEGSYTVISYVCDGSPDCVCSRTTTSSACGGNRNNCAAGPVTRTPSITLDGGPTEEFKLVTPAFKGLDNHSIDLTAPLSTDEFNIGNVPIANWISTQPTQCTIDQNYNFDVDAWDNYLPANDTEEFMDPFFGFGNKTYEFRCLDSAEDEKARIRIFVRDWNRDFSPKDAIDKLDSSVTKQDDGSPSGCSGKPCNDVSDWDDFFIETGDTAVDTPKFTSCSARSSETTLSITASSISAGSSEGSCSGGLCSDNLYVGAIVKIGDVFYLITDVGRTSFKVSAPFVKTSPPANLPIILYHNIPFPISIDD